MTMTNWRVSLIVFSKKYLPLKIVIKDVLKYPSITETLFLKENKNTVIILVIDFIVFF